MQISNFDSDFLNVISGFPQGSIAASILFNGFANIFFFTLLKLQMPRILQMMIH